mmetsp:Transcript_3571/g.7208  ORF Transcript_3571/g.7208 Transcript_3571/m.7208 type:complete len:114 (+) Transcript_3571:613-954(+)
MEMFLADSDPEPECIAVDWVDAPPAQDVAGKVQCSYASETYSEEQLPAGCGYADKPVGDPYVPALISCGNCGAQMHHLCQGRHHLWRQHETHFAEVKRCLTCVQSMVADIAKS